MIGIGTPISQSRIPRPMIFLQLLQRPFGEAYYDRLPIESLRNLVRVEAMTNHRGVGTK
jgi:hypothetical protein